MLAFEPLADRPGFEVVDRLERQRFRVYSSNPIELESERTARFQFPVGDAVSFETDAMTLPNVVGLTIRDTEANVVAELGHLDSQSLPAGSYTIELFTQIKTYLEVDSPMSIDIDMSSVEIDFGERTTVRVGARSRHDRPAETVTTTSDPHDLIAAIETFGSALKTLSPERSYPTLRGHPPDIELGQDLSIPSGLEQPDTGITIQLPPDYEEVFSAAPLAFYLGASLEPGSGPRLWTDEGFEYDFRTGRGYETELAETLKQVFFLDCLTRTEGFYDYDLHERRALEPVLDLDFASLYGQSPAQRLTSYLSVPYDLIAEYVPEWRLTAHVKPEPTSVEVLPFVVDDLAVIKSTQRSTPGEMVSPASGVNSDEVLTRSPDGGVTTRSTGRAPVETDSPYVQPVADGTLEQAWIGDRIPVGASKLTEAAFRNRLERDLTDGSIRIRIVVNDSRMEEERDLVNSAYGDRDALPFDVNVHHDTSVEGLRMILEEGCEFLHYIGHTEYDGFECNDGKLDASTLDATAVDAFLLNACNSYNQGIQLVEAGAIGGIVTLNDIINDGAVRMGESIARLLNAGFPLRASLSIAREESIQGGQYIVVGDGGMQVTQSASRTPLSLEIGDVGEDVEFVIKTYATDNAGLGTVFLPHIDGVDEFYLTSGTLGRFALPRGEVEQFFHMEEFPVRNQGELLWSTDISAEFL